MATFTPHALARALDMALEPEELRELVMNPDQRFWSRQFNSWTYQRGRLAAPVDESSGDRVVLSVLWRTDESWEADASRASLPEGRYVPGS